MTDILTNYSIGLPTGPAPVTDPTFIGTVTAPEIQFETPHTPIAPAPGLTYWDADDGTLATMLDTTAGVTLQHGQEMHVRCVNKTGVTITDGQAVYIDGAQGNRPTCTLAKADTHTTSRVIGVATQDIINNAEGYITVFGIVRGYDTTVFTEGDRLYLSAATAGLITNVAPATPNLVVCIGTAMNSTVNGSIFVNPQPAIDADVSFTAPTDLVAPGQSAVKTYIGHENTKEPTGFKDPELVVVNYDTATRKITLTGTVEAHYRGVQVATLTSGWVSDAIPPGPVAGYFLYYNGTAFVWSTTVWTFDVLHIAYVYYDPSGTFRFAVRETHGLMPWQAHRELHETVGTYLRSGGDLSSYVLGSTTAADRRPDVAVAVIADEDLQTSNPALSSKTYTHLYLTSTGTSTFVTGAAEILPVTGSTPYYNQFTGGNWVQTAVPAAQYTTVFLVAVPTTADAGSQTYRYLWLQGQSAGTLANEQAFIFQDMNLGQLANLATEFVPIAKVIVRNTGANWELTSVEKLIINRVASSTAAGNYISAVVTDASLSGIGTPSSPLGVVFSNANTWTGINTFSNATASTSTTTGAIVVTGGIGTGDGINAGGAIVSTAPASTVGTIRANSGDSTATSGTIASFRADLSANPAASSSAICVGFFPVLKSASGNAQNLTSTLALVSVYGAADHAGTGTVTGAVGIYGRFNNISSGTATSASGCYGVVVNQSTGVIASAYAIRAASAVNLSTGSITTNYGLYVDAQTAGATNYAIYTNAGLVRFGDNVDLAATKVYRINSVQVVGARDTGWSAMTGSPNKATVYDTATVTLAQLAGRVAALQAALTTHGLLGA